MQAKIMLINQHGACKYANVRKQRWKFSTFLVLVMLWVNLQCLYTPRVLPVLRVFLSVLWEFYQKTDWIFSTSIYQTNYRRWEQKKLRENNYISVIQYKNFYYTKSSLIANFIKSYHSLLCALDLSMSSGSDGSC